MLKETVLSIEISPQYNKLLENARKEMPQCRRKRFMKEQKRAQAAHGSHAVAGWKLEAQMVREKS